MKNSPTTSRFEAKLLRPAAPGKDGAWAFLLVPKDVSDTLPRRGRATVRGSINGQPFQATLEPDGNLSHWLKVDDALRESANAEIGDTVRVEFAPVVPEPEPPLPADLGKALKACPAAKETWDSTTTVARLDWIHWATSAKQQKTRERRISNACEMLAQGKPRVCCFDQSGFYSKSLSAPKVAD